MEERLFLSRLNRYRVLVGKSAVQIDLKLCNASRDHSKDMDEHEFFSHDSPLTGKRKFNDRAKLAGTSASAENIYRGNKLAEGPFWAWFKSAGHHKNMLREAGRAGVGIHEKTWTLMMGS